MPYKIANKPWDRFGVPNLLEVFHAPAPLEIIECDHEPGRSTEMRGQSVADALHWYDLEIKASKRRQKEFRRLLEGEQENEKRLRQWAAEMGEK